MASNLSERPIEAVALIFLTLMALKLYPAEHETRAGTTSQSSIVLQIGAMHQPGYALQNVVLVKNRGDAA